MMKTLIIIPSFNEEKNIESLVKEVTEYGYDYLIINDNSSDNTEKVARKNNFPLLDLSVNVGIAGVTVTGFKYAYEHDYDCVISIDGDGQHQPKYVKDLIDAIKDGSDYAVGSRFVTEKKPYNMRMLGSRILSFLIFLKTGKKFYDPTSGMRALGKKVIKDFSSNMNFYAEPDTVCYLLKKGYNVKEVQVEMNDRENGVSYFISPFKSIKFMVSVIISILFIQ